MTHPVSSFQAKPYRKLRFTWFEAVVLLAMLVVLATAGLDGIDGRFIGKDNNLELARHQAQPELMAQH